MPNFVLVYTGGSRPTSEAEGKKLTESWMGWFGTLGDNVVDAGNPFSPEAKSLSNGAVNDGAVGTAATGYSILRADSLSAATKLAQGCPHLQTGGKITVYEVSRAM